MKAVCLIIFILCLSLVSRAQDSWGKVSDSMGMVSRTKADKVLAHFDSVRASKLVYSLEDRYFYLIIKDAPCFKEYYIALDSLGRIDKMYPVIDKIQNKKQRKQKEQYQKILEEAKPFELNQYHSDFITRMPEATYTSGRYSYFVVKDINGKRYGEYRLSAITAPLPINKNLWSYLIRRLSSEIERSNKSSK